MGKSSKKITAVIAIVLLSLASFPLVSNAEKTTIQNLEIKPCGIDQELRTK